MHAFKKCSIANMMDGSENDSPWDDPDKKNSSDSHVSYFEVGEGRMFLIMYIRTQFLVIIFHIFSHI